MQSSRTGIRMSDEGVCVGGGGEGGSLPYTNEM